MSLINRDLNKCSKQLWLVQNSVSHLQEDIFQFDTARSIIKIYGRAGAKENNKEIIISRSVKFFAKLANTVTTILYSFLTKILPSVC